MQRVALLAMVLVVLGGCGRATDEDDQPDPADCARQVLEGDEAEYHTLRQRLAKRPNEELLAVLDSLRSKAATSAASVLVLPPGLSEIAATDARARKEGPLLARALGEAKPWLVRIEAHLVVVPEGPLLRRLYSYLPKRLNQVGAIPADVARSLIPRPPAPTAPQRAGLPVLELFDGQTGTLSLGAQVRFLMDYDASGNQDMKARPVVGGMSEGIEISLTARRSTDPNRLTLQVDAVWTTARRPIELFRTTVGTGDSEKTIQLPEMGISRMQDTVEAAWGEWLLAGARPSDPTEHPRFLLFRAVRLPPPTVQANEPGAVPGAGPCASCGAGGSCGK